MGRTPRNRMTAVEETQEQAQRTPDMIEGERLYWHGVCGDIPFQGVTISGIEFMRWTSAVVPSDEGGGRYRLSDRRLGHVVPMSQELVEDIRAKVADMVVVWPAGPGRGKCYIRKVSDPKYRRIPQNERPMGNYIYLVEVDNPNVFDRSKEPAPLVAPAA
jgi:hypothetical protein